MSLGKAGHPKDPEIQRLKRKLQIFDSKLGRDRRWALHGPGEGQPCILSLRTQERRREAGHQVPLGVCACGSVCSGSHVLTCSCTFLRVWPCAVCTRRVSVCVCVCVCISRMLMCSYLSMWLCPWGTALCYPIPATHPLVFGSVPPAGPEGCSQEGERRKTDEKKTFLVQFWPIRHFYL